MMLFVFNLPICFSNIDLLCFRHAQNKKEEIHLFTLAMDQLKSSCERSSVELIDGFSKIKKLRFVDLQHQASLGQIDSDAVEQLRAQLQDMADNLMELEVSQIEQVNSLIDDLYSANKEISADCLTHINNYCGRLLELEKQYYESAQNLTSKLIERYQVARFAQACISPLSNRRHSQVMEVSFD
jgi:hypothetical protein